MIFPHNKALSVASSQFVRRRGVFVVVCYPLVSLAFLRFIDVHNTTTTIPESLSVVHGRLLDSRAVSKRSCLCVCVFRSSWEPGGGWLCKGNFSLSSSHEERDFFLAILA